MEYSRFVMIGLTLCVMLCVTAARSTLLGNSGKMSQATGGVMDIMREMQDKMYAQEGFKITEITTLLDKLCEQRATIEDLKEELDLDVGAAGVRRQRRTPVCRYGYVCEHKRDTKPIRETLPVITDASDMECRITIDCQEESLEAM